MGLVLTLVPFVAPVSARAEAVPPPPVLSPVLVGGVGDGGAAASALVNASAVLREPAGTYLLSDSQSYQLRRYDPVTGTIDVVYGNGHTETSQDAEVRGDVDAVASALPIFDRLWVGSDGTTFGTDRQEGPYGGDLFSISPNTHVLHLVYANTPPDGTVTHYTPVFVRPDGTFLVDVQVVNGTPADAVWAFAPGAAPGAHTSLLTHGAQEFAQSPDGTLYEARRQGNGIWRVNGPGSETLVAGTVAFSSAAPTTDGVPALGAGLSVANLAADNGGHLIFYDQRTTLPYRLRSATVGGAVNTLAHQTMINASDGPVCLSNSLTLSATAAVLPCQGLRSFARDGSQNGSGGTVLAGLAPGVTESSTPASTATAFFSQMNGLAIDPATGDPVVSSQDSIVRVHGSGASGTVTRIAGDPSAVKGSGDGGPATAAGLSPRFLTYGPDGTLYVEDGTGALTTIRAVKPDGTISTIAGGGTTALADGVGAKAAYFYGATMAVDAAHIYISSALGSSNYGVFSLDLATNIWHLVLGGGSTEPMDGLAAAAALFTDPVTVAIRFGDGALLVRTRQTWVLSAGLLRHIPGPERLLVGYTELGSDSSGSTYDFQHDVYGQSTVFKTTADGTPPLLLLGALGAAAVGPQTEWTQMAVAADGTMFVIGKGTPTPSLVKVTSSTGPWPDAAPTLTIAAPLSGAGPFVVTITPPPTGPHWHSIVKVSQGTLAPLSPEDGRTVGGADLTSGTPSQIRATGSYGPCAGGDCYATFLAGNTYSFSLFSFPDGTPASVPKVSVASATPVLTGDAFSPVPPVRVLDTRTGLGTAHGQPMRLQRGQVIGLTLPLDGNQAFDAAVLNVTVVAPSASTFVSLYPGGSTTPPAVSNINVSAGQTAANLVTVKTTRGVVWIKNAAGSVDVVADLVGFYATDATSTFTPLPPSRILDTRSGVGSPKAQLGPRGTIDLQITGRAGIPADAKAVVMNVTATQATTSTYVQVYPTPTTAGAAPMVSSLNVRAAQTVANQVIVGIGAGGRVRLGNHLGSLDLLADVAGYFSADARGSLFTPIDPIRVLDTRLTSGRLGPGGVHDVAMEGVAGIPAGASAVVFNLTAVGASTTTYIQAYPTPVSGSAFPTISTINTGAGSTVANLASVALGTAGSVRLRNAVGTVDLLADVAGYYIRPPA